MESSMKVGYTVRDLGYLPHNLIKNSGIGRSFVSCSGDGVFALWKSSDIFKSETDVLVYNVYVIQLYNS